VAQATYQMEWLSLPVIVRKAAETDLPQLLKIEEECFGNEKFTPETIRAFVARSDTFVLMAVDERELLGSAMCMVSTEGNVGKIASIAVLRRYRGRGVGSALLGACENEFRSHDLGRYSLEVETENESAISLYLSRGYEPKGIIKDFYSVGRDAYCMEKKVTSANGVQVKLS
jgi:ribosomal protein S18 acetylase RimI-like enzyme